MGCIFNFHFGLYLTDKQNVSYAYLYYMLPNFNQNFLVISSKSNGHVGKPLPNEELKKSSLKKEDEFSKEHFKPYNT